VLKIDYIHTSQLSSIGTNRDAKRNVVNRELKTQYMMFPGIKYTMFSFKSKSDGIIFIRRRVKPILYIEFTIKFKRNELPREIKRFSRSENAINAVAWSKVLYVFLQIKL
jgi:hypothetical protein